MDGSQKKITESDNQKERHAKMVIAVSRQKNADYKARHQLDRRLVLRTAAPMPKPRDFNPHPKLWHPCSFGNGRLRHCAQHYACDHSGGSVLHYSFRFLISFTHVGQFHSRSALAFRYASLPSPPKPRYGTCTHVVANWRDSVDKKV